MKTPTEGFLVFEFQDMTAYHGHLILHTDKASLEICTDAGNTFYRKPKSQSWPFPWLGRVNLEGFPEEAPGAGAAGWRGKQGAPLLRINNGTDLRLPLKGGTRECLGLELSVCSVSQLPSRQRAEGPVPLRSPGRLSLRWAVALTMRGALGTRGARKAGFGVMWQDRDEAGQVSKGRKIWGM